MQVSYLAVSTTRCTVQMCGCNFRCLGCFSKERDCCGTHVTASQLADKIPQEKEVVLAGGEPTMYRQGLLQLIKELKGRHVILSTNGYLLDEPLLKALDGITVHIDIKALDPALHRKYTGMDNARVLEAVRLLHEHHLDIEVSTVYIPGVVETEEIVSIARFLADIGNIDYKIIRYVPVGNFSRRPNRKEIEKAVYAAGKYLANVYSSMEKRSHPKQRDLIIIPEKDEDRV